MNFKLQEKILEENKNLNFLFDKKESELKKKDELITDLEQLYYSLLEENKLLQENNSNQKQIEHKDLIVSKQLFIEQLGFHVDSEDVIFLN